MSENKEKVALKDHPMQGQQALNPNEYGVTMSQGVPKHEFGQLPVADVTLPSEGRVYPVESPLHMRKSVEIRPMTAKDEDILTSRVLLKKGTAVNELLKNCIVDKSVASYVDEMVSGDRNALMIAIRVSGYGREMKATVDCEQCSNQFEHFFDLGSFDIEHMKYPPVTEGTNLFTAKLPVSNVDVSFKLLTGAEERELSKAQENRKKKGIGAHENNVTSRLFAHIVSLAGETDRSKLIRMVNNLPAKDSLFLRKKLDECAPGLNTSNDIECPSCGHESEVDMPYTANFFWPDA